MIASRLRVASILATLVASFVSVAQEGAAPGTLAEYLAAHKDLEVQHDLIACAAGGHVGFTTRTPAPTSVFFYPVEGATDFRYFETPSAESDPGDYSLYRQMDKPIVPVFNGYLRRFVTDYIIRETWVVLTYLTPGVLHMSGHVRLKGNTKPTEYGPQLVEVLERGGDPVFKWRDGRVAENAIYFEVVSDPEGDLISGTYTTAKRFRFYDTSNVTHNIRDVNPAPSLTQGKSYVFTLMGVSRDNWVNLIARKEFTAP